MAGPLGTMNPSRCDLQEGLPPYHASMKREREAGARRTVLILLLAALSIPACASGTGPAPPLQVSAPPEVADVPPDAPPATSPDPPPAALFPPAAGEPPPAPPPPEPAPVAAPAPAAAGRVAGVARFLGSDGEPAPSVQVVLWGGPGGPRRLVGQTVTDEQGRFSFEGVKAGEHTLSTWSGEGEPWVHRNGPLTVNGGKSAPADLLVDRPLFPEARIPVTGTLAWDDGRPVRKFRFRLREGERVYYVAGENGRFECAVRRAGPYHVQDVEADGAPPDDSLPRIQILRGEPVSLVLFAPRHVALLVVDRETGEPLPSARALRRRWEEDAFLYDDFPNARTLEGPPLPAGGDGRIPLGKLADSETLFVVADGHAWAMVKTVRGSAETRVPLGPGGTVRLSVEGWSGLPDATVTAEASEPWRLWTLTAPGPEGEGVYEGIPAGTWEFKVRRGWFHERGEVYGEGSVEVLAGRESRLALKTRPSAAGAPVPVSGTVTVPASWDLRRTRLRFEGVDPTNSSVEQVVHLDLPAEGTAVPFSLQAVPPGVYEVQIDPQWYATVTVPPAGGTFDFRLPGPGTLLVRVLDDATGEPLDEAIIAWHTDAGRSGYGLDSADRTEDPGEFRIVAPAGRVALAVRAEGYAEAFRGGSRGLFSGKEGVGPVEVREGIETVLTIRLRRAGTLQLSYEWEGEAPDWDDAMVMGEVGREESWTRAIGMNLDHGAGKIERLEPGSYTVRSHSFGEEFEPVKAVPVEVKAGETTKVVIHLVRKR